jgi:hypothetical protein
MIGDRRVVQCNYIEGTGVASKGARAFVTRSNGGNGTDRVMVLVYSRGARWVEKWEDARRLGNFRIKTLPPKHPLADRTFAPPEALTDLLITSTCCDSHNQNCEPPSELCCNGCTEAAHDTFPIRHADGSCCAMEGR